MTHGQLMLWIFAGFLGVLVAAAVLTVVLRRNDPEPAPAAGVVRRPTPRWLKVVAVIGLAMAIAPFVAFVVVGLASDAPSSPPVRPSTTSRGL